jgi:hypothetical protein
VILTSISTHAGSVLMAIGSPEELWTSQTDGHLVVRLLGGGLACLPCDEVHFMALHRQGRPGERDRGKPVMTVEHDSTGSDPENHNGPADRNPEPGDGHAPQNQTDALIQLTRTRFELLHDRQGRPFARPKDAGDGRALRIPSRTLRERVQVLGHESSGAYPRKEVVNAVMDALAAEAVHVGRCAEVHVRVAWVNGVIYLDLADGTGRVVRVVPGGWEVVAYPPVVFAFVRTAEPLSEPSSGGSIEELRGLPTSIRTASSCSSRSC